MHGLNGALELIAAEAFAGGAEFQVERGMVDRVVTRKELPTILASILRTLMMGRSRLAPV